ncbi:MAG TPA: response regulator transcription factor [Bacteroidia bacterium]|nr:response regulator transcription factor [Bacteroidia bacterium]HNT81025.1 response regulator transcription factor [Bacteroidia bacterium]
MERQIRILLVEDEKSIADAIALNLEMEGHKVVKVDNGKQALKTFNSERFNLIILDIMLPEMDGFSVCDAIRLENTEVPILFLTAKNTSEDRIKGLKLGADDYLCKPFELEELILRVNNLIKRSSTTGQNGKNINLFAFNGFEIDFAERKIAQKGKDDIALTKKENQLLKLLIEHKNEVVSRDYILETVWGYDIYPSTRTIDNFLVSFRKYFEKDPSNPQHFVSVRSVGYKFVE